MTNLTLPHKTPTPAPALDGDPLCARRGRRAWPHQCRLQTKGPLAPDIVIQAENLGKRYPTPATRRRIAATWPCALKDVNFEIRRGEFAPNYGIIRERRC